MKKTFLKKLAWSFVVGFAAGMVSFYSKLEAREETLEELEGYCKGDKDFYLRDTRDGKTEVYKFKVGNREENND